MLITNDLTVLVVRFLAHGFVQHREGRLLALAYMATGLARLVEGEPTILAETAQTGLGPQQRNVDASVRAPSDGVDGKRRVSMQACGGPGFDPRDHTLIQGADDLVGDVQVDIGHDVLRCEGGTPPDREVFPVGVKGAVDGLEGSESGDVYRDLIGQPDE
ncbi:hypothetical protein D3C78_1308610 [compost metagenome]